MSERLIEELKRENLCTHFILPLLKLNKFSFASFIDSYIATSTHEKDCLFITCKYIAVRIVQTTLLSRRVFMKAEYHGLYRDDAKDNLYVVYKVPARWIADLDLFISGKYSEMSDNAKNMIIRWSRLPYRIRNPNDGHILTDGRLCALYKDSQLRDMWERRIEPWEHIHGELLSIPDERSFIELDTLTRIQEPEQ